MFISSGKVVGGALLVAGTVAVWVWPQAKVPDAGPEPLRPVRSVVVSEVKTMPDFSFTGVVKAGSDCKLVFKQPGRIQHIAVKKAQKVKKGDKIAWLIPDDFQNRLSEAEAAAKRDRLTFERVEKAAKRNAVSKEELSKAEANLRRSEAQYQLAKTAMEETVLYAPFDSLVADVPPSDMDMVNTSTLIAYLLDLSKIKVDVAVPESFVILQRQIEWKTNAVALVSFDSASDRNYEAKFVEWKSMAEKNNQTFTATYMLPAPKDLMLYPGMSATVSIPGSSYEYKGCSGETIEMPDSAVGVDSDGSYYVWKLLPDKDEDGVFTATKCRLTGCARTKDTELVWAVKGVQPGDRVATAGVTLLTEGRRVLLLEGRGK